MVNQIVFYCKYNYGLKKIFFKPKNVAKSDPVILRFLLKEVVLAGVGMPMACVSSEAKDQTCTTAVTMPHP